MAKKVKTNHLKWYNYGLMGLFSALCVFGGLPKFIPNVQMAEMTAALGLTMGFMYFLGVCWIAAAVGVWFTKTRVWAVLGTIPIISGAIMAVISIGMYPAIGMLSLYVLVNVLMLWQIGFFKKLSA